MPAADDRGSRPRPPTAAERYRRRLHSRLSTVGCSYAKRGGVAKEGSLALRQMHLAVTTGSHGVFKGASGEAVRVFEGRSEGTVDSFGLHQNEFEGRY